MIEGDSSGNQAARSDIPPVGRSGLNQGAYLGEAIDIQAVLAEVAAVARSTGWIHNPILEDPALHLPAWVRSGSGIGPKLYISTGIHGDEPAGPLAVLELMRANDWPQNADIWLCPCLNPTGFPLNRRENAAGIDLNRQYAHRDVTEVRAHIDWLFRQPRFDVSVCLHEDWESHGFYLYELNPDSRPSHAEEIIRQVSQVCPIDWSSVIEGRPAAGGIIRPDVDPQSRPQWPEAFFLLNHKTRHSYTLEAPSDFPIQVRVKALVRGVRVVLEAFQPGR